MTVTIKEDSTLAFYNGTLMPGATPVCGGGFVKNEAKTLDATKCENDALFGTLFKDNFKIYKVDGNKLYQGECGESGTATDCSTAAKRATTLETTFATKV